MPDENIEWQRESEDSGYRFVIIFKDLHILRQWDITQQVVINDDIGYMRYLVDNFPAPMKDHLIAFFDLFLRAIDSEN
ncbi:MAG: hypothetical protein PVJ86_02780 [Phycisphaerales bacterium]|jgi:hypothetical protein